MVSQKEIDGSAGCDGCNTPSIVAPVDLLVAYAVAKIIVL